MKHTNSFSVLLIAVVFSAFISCEEEPETKQPNDIYKIVFAQGGCMAFCPAESFSIDSSLEVRYHGVRNVTDTGFFIGRITGEQWYLLNDRFREMNYQSFDSLYPDDMAEDAQQIEFHFYHRDGETHCETTDHLPVQTRNLIEWLRGFVLSSNLQPAHAPFDFDTKAEKQVPMPESFQFTEPIFTD